MEWNYRLLAHEDGDETFLQAHEVHYDLDGVPNGYTAKAVRIGSEDIEGIKWTLDKLRECLDKPVLSASNFPDEYKEEIK